MRILFLVLVFPILSSGLVEARGTAASNQIPFHQDGEPLNKPLPQASIKIPLKTLFQRVIQARLFHSGTWTLSDSSQTPITVARTLASLEPSFLTGLLRLPDRGELSKEEEEAFSAVKSAVLAVNKKCRFDVLIYAGGSSSAETFVQRMKAFSERLHPDSWTFYIPPDTKAISPEVFQHGIAQAHAAGQMVGYDGPLSLIPEGVDFIVVRAWDFKIAREQIDFLNSKQKIPVIVEFPTTFGSRNYPEVVAYMENLKTADRVARITQLAEKQSSWGYHFAYPIFYPLYPSRHAFDATKDNILLVSIRALLAKFN